MAEYKMWCDQCDAWVSEVEPDNNIKINPSWICCKACGNGLILVE